MTKPVLRLREVADSVASEAVTELVRAMERFPSFNSPHEGYAVIREELERELWQHVCENTGRSEAAREEAIQVAAMALRYVIDLCDEPEREVDGTPSTALCECGHPAASHVMLSQQQRCQATVYTDAPLGGGNVYPCGCRQFARAES